MIAFLSLLMATTLKPLFRLIEFHGIAVNDLEVTAGGLPPRHDRPVAGATSLQQDTYTAMRSHLFINRTIKSHASFVVRLASSLHVKQLAWGYDF
ncbi:hypothetical protein [Aporhodopirellula aestuarii]|uniref:Secreted protein n=1 Tax=Aporhodopirellula aestuarii TaxID=2950107 RepID=A0ABT0TXY5_9BACT|nr:hypothetical protein [Aporhodopirellula aestuarii]MCM2369457.1 hypothetical protein [Aporhodopirellula aestuarii]